MVDGLPRRRLPKCILQAEANAVCVVLPPPYIGRLAADRDDDDYDIDFYTVGPVPPDHLEAQDSQPSPREQLEVSQSSQLYERYVRMTSLSVCPPQFLVSSCPLQQLFH